MLDLTVENSIIAVGELKFSQDAMREVIVCYANSTGIASDIWMVGVTNSKNVKTFVPCLASRCGLIYVLLNNLCLFPCCCITILPMVQSMDFVPNEICTLQRASVT